MILYLLQGASLGLSGAASPGPFQAFIIGQSLKNGWRRTLPAVLAPLISDGPIILLAALALASVPAAVLSAVQTAGGLFVLYLAWKAARAFWHFDAAGEEPAAKTRRTLWQAVLMNFLNPGPYIFWSVLAGPVLVRGWQEAPANGLGFLLGFYLAMTGALALLVVLFGAARRFGPRASRILSGLSALALLGFGLYQLWQGGSELI